MENPNELQIKNLAMLEVQLADRKSVIEKNGSDSEGDFLRGDYEVKSMESEIARLKLEIHNEEPQ